MARPMVASEDYPRELERSVTLPDGSRMWIRPIRPEDAERLIDFYGRLSQQTAYQRFFTVMQRLPPDWAKILASVDYRRRLALVAEQASLDLIGVGRYEPTEREDTAEIAFVVQDDWQGRGLGKILLFDLLAAAQARGLHRFRAWVLADNARTLGLLARHTDIERRKLESGVVEITFTFRAPSVPRP
jgi:RimJ/RimL family protein N-acetyltransferase